MPLIEFIDGYETVANMETALGIPAGRLAETLRRKTMGPGQYSTSRWVAPCIPGSPWAGW